MARPPAGPPRSLNPLQEALALHKRGKVSPARKIYRDIVARQPGNADALELWGLASAELGEYTDAVKVLTRAAAVNPGSLNVHFNLGMAQRKARQAVAAEASFRRALELVPSHADAHFQLGQALMEQTRIGEAIISYQAAIRQNSRFADAHYNLGLAQVMGGDLVGAVGSYSRAAQLQPNTADALTELGKTLMSLHKFDGAIQALEKAVGIDPKAYYALALLGTAYRFEKRFPEAVATLQRATAIDKKIPDALFELIIVKRLSGDFEDLPRLEQEAARLVRRPEDHATSMHVLPLIDDPEAHRKAARAYVKARWPGAEAPISPAMAAKQPELRARGTGPNAGPIRVGYFSSDFGNHPVSHAISGFIAAHDRRRFEIHGFSLALSDGPPVRPEMAAALDHLHQVGELASSDIVAKSRALGLDIAIDLNGHTTGARTAAFAQRLAPIQVNYLGFPCTMGAHQIDYLIADDFVIPAGTDAFYDEKIVRLPGCYLPNDLARETAGATPSRAANGLPAEGVVFAAFNTFNKISPDVFACWMRILTACPGSVLWFPATSQAIQANFRREAETRGVTGNRLVFGPFVAERRDHIARHALADLFLDCLAYNAHTTAADALWAGLPVVTCVGKSFPSRVAGSLVRAAGVPELATTALADYEAMAIRLAHDAAARADLRQRLLAARTTTSLYDRRRFARHMEWAFAHMVEISAAGQPPVAFDIPAAV